MPQKNKFLITERPLEQLDVILISGDAYIDHPSFGPALIGRYLESHGFKVGIIPQPDWKKDDDFLKLGPPKLFFGVTSGNLDSMVANYTADKKIRRDDMYSPNAKAGMRPDRATIVYSNKIKQLFPDVPIVIGGIESSLRRFAHYDYWDNSIRRPILFDTRADYLVYGMGEHAILQIAKSQITKSQIPNTAIITKDISEYKNALILPSYEEVLADKKTYAKAFKMFYLEGRKKNPRIIIQPCQKRYLVAFPPHITTSSELESYYKLPFERKPHPMYSGKKIPAWDFVKFSTVSHRGCFGGCSFCAIDQHQGKYIVSRSIESIKNEIKTRIMTQPDFKGNILDVGGPTSNMYGIICKKEDGCVRSSCIYPNICKDLDFSQKPSLELLKEIRKIPGIKNVFIGSGVRHDLALMDPDYLKEIVAHHISGQLSVAPEHSCEGVLALMGKPSIDKFINFRREFEKLNKKCGKKQYLIPYLISSHPGATLQDAFNLAVFMKKNNIRVEQVQNFTPTPMTLSTCMYYTHENPLTGKPVFVATGEERAMQKALLQPQLQKNKKLVDAALKKLGCGKNSFLVSYIHGE